MTFRRDLATPKTRIFREVGAGQWLLRLGSSGVLSGARGIADCNSNRLSNRYRRVE